MHPALSVILFTTLSGVGFGLLFWMGVWAAPETAVANAPLGWALFVFGYGISVAGLLASTRHLGHPERAWRAFSQWRSSWLSREGVLAVAALSVFGLFSIGWLFFNERWTALGWIGAALALCAVIATGMIYAQLRTVPRWRTPLTVISYVGFAAAGGALALALIRAMFETEPQEAPVRLAISMVTGAWALKLLWWRRGDQLRAITTPETATGLGDIGHVRMLEPPHTGSNYLLNEMGCMIARKHALKLRMIALGLGGIAPLLFLAMSLITASATLWLLLAFAAHLTGVIVERWLFFAEAKHVVTVYYDRRQEAA